MQMESACEDGTVVFKDGCTVLADIILYCTGYKYHFPFLKTNGIVTVDDNRVGPLYKHVFPPFLAPWLSFVGIPSKTLSFPTFEAQSKWIAGVLSGRILLPSQEEMMEDVSAFYSTLEASHIPKHHTHDLLHYVSLKNGDYRCALNLSRTSVSSRGHTVMNGKMTTSSCKPTKTSAKYISNTFYGRISK
ncbi:unnamed protein product [Dovyalis caffra]|uniref:Flavin-containing monooxygenase n=1 Tax=Dovyalis caffra TaxID=77055 RepID=A0AAV1RUF4_9ROSI|nr:unnamed protein product [Dovyalis caffra]